jgi:excisionase family DNA binding protein
MSTPPPLDAAALGQAVAVAVVARLGIGEMEPRELAMLFHPNRLISARTACLLLDVSTRTLYRLIECGDLPQPRRLGRSRCWLFSELQAVIKQLPRATASKE